MKRSTILTITIAACIIIPLLICVPFLTTNFTHFRIRSHFHHLFYKTAHKHTHCVIYDKTPRTGSSTILYALRKCWKRNKYWSRRPRKKRDIDIQSYVEECLSLNHDRVIIGGNHFKIYTSDIRQIAHECKNVFFVTSTRSMKERLLSKAKYEASGGRVYLNRSLTDQDWVKALRKLSRDQQRLEEKLERYPFLTRSWGISPDYVIRAEYLISDLRYLLNAFGCNGVRIRSKNIHSYGGPNSTNTTTIIATNTSDSSNITTNLTNSTSTGSDADGLNKEENVHDDNDDNDDDDNNDDDEEEEDDDDDDDLEDIIEVNNYKKTDNINTITRLSKVEKNLLEEIKLVYGDRRHLKMSKHAEKYNEQGLLKAEDFTNRDNTPSP